MADVGRRPRSAGRRLSAIGTSGAVVLLPALLLSTWTATGAPTAFAQEGQGARCPATVTSVTSADIDRVFALAERKFAPLADLKATKFPFGASDGATTMATTNLRGWTSGFFPASTWLLYQDSADRAWLDRARTWTRAVLPVASWTGTHDLGFMVGLPADLGVELDPNTKNRTKYRKAMLTAAQSLSSRWNAKVKAFKSGEYNGQWGLIMDSAMNAPLLIARGQQLGGTQGGELAQRGTDHLQTLARTFIRPDGSTVHRVAFDPDTGAALGPVAGQGAGPNTAWARGQAWAIYGFAQGAALTGDPSLLSAAQTTANYWLAQVPDGCIPPWDFSINDPNALRDSSASAIAASGLLLLADLTSDPTTATAYRRSALTALGTLASPAWTPENTSNPGLLQGQTYNVPKFEFEGSYSWGDTYLLHALHAARRLVG